MSEAESAPLASSSISAGEVISQRVAEKEAGGAGLMLYGVRRDWVKCLFRAFTKLFKGREGTAEALSRTDKSHA